MKRTAVKIIRITAGILLLILGAIGGLIPIFQGWIFGLLGLWLLSKEIPWVHRYYEKIKEWVERKRKKPEEPCEVQKIEDKTSGEA
jgi:uncharacterized membrane protein YbaN (DUF454 family)